MSKCTYKKYDSNKYLVYADVAQNYPREKFAIASGKNNLSVWLYGKENTKGLIIVAPGHKDSNDIKLYEIMYFVDAGFQVLCFDYSGCYTSEGSAFGGYAVTAVLNYPHRVDAVVSASGFYSTKEQWECSVKRFTGPAYFLIKPINLLFIHFKYGADKNLSAVSGINKDLYMEHDKAILEMICSFLTIY